MADCRPTWLNPYAECSSHRQPSWLISPNSGGWTCASLTGHDENRNEKKRKLQPCSGWRWLQGSGQHRGHLIGGCLEAVDWLRGTPVWPEPSVWRNSILFLETSEDEPSPTVVMYMLRALAATGALREARGILYGRPYGDEAKFEAYDAALLQVLAELGLSSLPLVTRMDFGHTDPKFIVPLGVEAEIDCDRQQLRFSNHLRLGDILSTIQEKTRMMKTHGLATLVAGMIIASPAAKGVPDAMPVAQQNALVQEYCAVCHTDVNPGTAGFPPAF